MPNLKLLDLLLGKKSTLVKDRELGGYTMAVTAPTLPIGAEEITGQIVCTLTGTTYVGPDKQWDMFIVQGSPTNTGIIYIGKNGTGSLTTSNGYGLGAGQQLPIPIENLNMLRCLATVAGEKLCWILA